MVWLLSLLNGSLELTLYNTSWRPGNQLRNQMTRSIFHFSHYFSCTLYVARGSPSAGSHRERSTHFTCHTTTSSLRAPGFVISRIGSPLTINKSRGLGQYRDVKLPCWREGLCRVLWVGSTGKFRCQRSLILFRGFLGEGNSNKQLWGWNKTLGFDSQNYV